MSNEFNGQRTEDIVRAVKDYDTGVCNPRKIKEGQELRDDAISELMDRGYSREEADNLLKDED